MKLDTATVSETSVYDLLFLLCLNLDLNSYHSTTQHFVHCSM